MLEVAADDARVVRAVPVAPRRPRDELQPEPHGLRRRLAGQAAEERDRLASVAQQPLVDRPPPRAARRRRVERIEHAAARLPAHERQRRPPERQVPRRAARRPAEHPRHQREARRGIVAHGRDLRLGPSERDCVLAHRRVVIAASRLWRLGAAGRQRVAEPARELRQRARVDVVRGLALVVGDVVKAAGGQQVARAARELDRDHGVAAPVGDPDRQARADARSGSQPSTVGMKPLSATSRRARGGSVRAPSA